MAATGRLGLGEGIGDQEIACESHNGRSSGSPDPLCWRSNSRITVMPSAIAWGSDANDCGENRTGPPSLMIVHRKWLGRIVQGADAKLKASRVRRGRSESAVTLGYRSAATLSVGYDTRGATKIIREAIGGARPGAVARLK